MSDIIEFLRARLDEDEASARAASPGRWTATGTRVERGGDTLARMAIPSGMYPTRIADAEHIARWDPTRALAEIEAKRRVIDLCAAVADTELSRIGVEAHDLAFGVLDVLAQPYAGHADFDPAWRTA